MADQQDQPDDRTEGAPVPPPQPPSGEIPAAPAKKIPPKKAPAKAAKKAVKKAEPRKAPAKKVTKTTPPPPAAAAPPPPPPPPAKKAPPPPPPPPAPAPPADTNGAGNLVDGAKAAAAQAKSTVEQASDSVARPVPAPVAEPRFSPTPLAVAFAVALLAIYLVRRLRSEDTE
jgi:hypothetical protein